MQHFPYHFQKLYSSFPGAKGRAAPCVNRIFQQNGPLRPLSVFYYKGRPAGMQTHTFAQNAKKRGLPLA